MADDVLHIGQLQPDPENARKHNQRNIGMIERALQEVGAARSIVVDENGTVLAGNGVLEAAAAAGIERVRVVDADGNTIIAVRRTNLTPEQKRKLAIYDNRTAELAEWDTDVLRELADDGLDLSQFWYEPELGPILGQEPDIVTETDDDVYTKYTQATNTPVYEPTGEQPPLPSLFDTTRTDALLRDIEAADIPDDVRTFLRLAAYRHTVFHYQRIADYYAHAEPEVQRLMEDSALVIIDFKRAIELGYVRLTERLDAIMANGVGLDDEDDFDGE